MLTSCEANVCGQKNSSSKNCGFLFALANIVTGALFIVSVLSAFVCRQLRRQAFQETMTPSKSKLFNDIPEANKGLFSLEQSFTAYLNERRICLAGFSFMYFDSSKVCDKV